MREEPWEQSDLLRQLALVSFASAQYSWDCMRVYRARVAWVSHNGDRAGN